MKNIDKQIIKSILSIFCDSHIYNCKYIITNENGSIITFQLKFNYRNDKDFNFVKNSLDKILNVYLHNFESSVAYQRDLEDEGEEYYYSLFNLTFS